MHVCICIKQITSIVFTVNIIENTPYRQEKLHNIHVFPFITAQSFVAFGRHAARPFYFDADVD